MLCKNSDFILHDIQIVIFIFITARTVTESLMNIDIDISNS